ncbi:nesprin-2 isoform X2 [Pygocentrus nattereri]|uniref:nesprin-2 isoform X2 n=1 Tax=Pygocentrus nattereri TaxID=42514 RepID=UPI0008147866|nr:nesprin-2 isoform X2 [Pygocentrus nattereri]
MASEGDPDAPLGDARAVPLDIDDVHMLLQVEQEQVQKRTFTNWINAQLSKRTSPSLVQDLFADLSDGTRLLDLLEVMSGQRMKREKGHGVFQQRGNVETALKFLKNKSIKLVNINIPDIIEGKPSIILGLVWTIILHCHIEELASTLSFGSRSSSLESLSSQDSAPGTPVRGSPVPHRASPLHTRFRLSAKKALLLWVRDQCRKVGCSVSVKDFKSSWRSGVAFLAIVCSLRPDLVDLSLTETRSNLQNLEEAFIIAQQELGISRLLEPEDIDISNPDEKSIMTYVAQFLQYSNDLPSADDDLEASPNLKVREMTCWLQQAHEELLDVWSSTDGEGYGERYQAFQTFIGSFYEQRRPVMSMLSAVKRSAKLSEEQLTLRKAWDLMEGRLQQYKTELDAALPAPLHTLGKWLHNMESVLSEEQGDSEDHAGAARDAREKQEKLKVLLGDMSGHLDTLHHFCNPEDDASSQVPAEKLEEMKRRFTNARVTAKYHGIKLEYQERWHHVHELLGHLKSKLKSWRGPYGSQEAVLSLMQDWHDSINTQDLLSMLKAALHKLKQTASTYTNKAALAEASGAVSRQVKEAEREIEISSEAAAAVKDTMGRVLAEWESYKDCSYSLQVFLEGQTQTAGKEQTSRQDLSLSERSSCQARLNEAGNYLIEVTESSTSCSLADELSRLNTKWADFIKRTKFAVSPQQPSSVAPCGQATQMLLQEAGWTLREAVEVSSGALRKYRKKLRVMVKKISELDLDSLSPEFSEEALQKLKTTLLEMREDLSKVEQACEGMQRGASLLEGRLAELGHWSTEAIEVCQQLKEWQNKHQGPHPRVKKLISRGLQLESQVEMEAQALQSTLESAQRSSSLPYLSISTLQDRAKCTVKHCQDIIDTLSCMEVKREGETEGDQPPPKVVVRAYITPEPQAGTLQRLETQTSKAPQERRTQPESQQSYGCFQVEKHTKTISGTQTQVLSLDNPDEPSVLKQSPAVISSFLGKQEIGKKVQILTIGQSQSRMLLDTPQQCPGSSVSDTSSQNMCSIQPMTSEQKHTDAQYKSKPQTTTTTLHQQHGLLEKAQLFPQSLEVTHPHAKAPPQAQTKLHTQGDTPTHTLHGISPHTPKQAQAKTKALSPGARQRQRGQGKTQGPTQIPEQTEVYSRAQAMARSRMERAKQRLHKHIEEVIIIFSNRVISEEQAKRKQGALRQLKPAVLEEFLEAVEGVGAFCSEAQLAVMEDLSVSVMAQWEAVRSAIEFFLPDLWREVQRRESINMAILKCEIDTNTACVPDQVCHEQACSSVKETSGRLEVLRGLSETLKHPASSCLATTNLRESGDKLETVQYQHSRGEQAQDSTLLRETGLPADQSLSQVHSQGIIQAYSVETKQTPNRTIIHIGQAQEEGTASQEVHSSAAHSAFQKQLQMNTEQLRREFPTSSSLLPATLSTHLQELQTLAQQTEALWMELDLQSSPHMEDGCIVESKRVQLIQQWRGQQICFQARMKSLENALKLLEPVDVHIKMISDQLNQLAQKPVDITGFALIDPGALHGGLKLLGEHIKKELRLVAESESKVANSAGLNEAELQNNLPLQQTIQNCTHRLQQLNHRLGRARSALQTLEQFLSRLHQLDVELSTTPGTPVLSSAASIRERLQQAREEAVELDCMLQDAGMSVKLGTRTSSCQAMVSTLFNRAAEMEASGCEGMIGSQKKEEEEQRARVLEKKKKVTLLAALREVQGTLERQSLKEATLPALQHRLRCLTDLENKLDALHSDIQSLQDTSAHTAGLTELEEQWKETHRVIAESQEECLSLIELLKKFQSCRSHLGSTLQRAEQTISEQASYMGKDNLQRLIGRVSGIKSELNALGDGVEEFRAVCRQLQSQMRKIPDCPDTPFESEADALMDRWLDVTERTDCCLDNLQVGLSLWEKLLLMAGEVDGWTTRKLMSLAQSQPFQTEQEVTAMQEELWTQEENIEHFHGRSVEIQELLQSREHPLELQVIESQLRKRMGEVKELFAETGDVFKELVAVKAQVAARMGECMSSTLTIKDALNTLSAPGSPEFFQEIQGLSEQLRAEEEQANTVLQQVALLTSVASPESLNTLAEEGARLQESICATKEMIVLKRKQADSLNNAKDTEREDLNSQGCTVQRTQDLPPMQSNLSDTQHPQGQFSSSHKTEDSPQESKENEKPLEEPPDVTDLKESTALASRLQVDILDTGTQSTRADTVENLKEPKVVLGLKAEDNSDLKVKVKRQTPFKKESQDVHVLSDKDKKNSFPQGEVGCFPSLQNQLQQVEKRLQLLKEQNADLPVLFPWSGLDERRGAFEQAHGLLETATTLRDQMKEQTQLGEDSSLTELSCSSLEIIVSSLIQQLSDTCEGLDEGIQKEQHCSLMLKQCSEILDCLERRMQEEISRPPHVNDQKSQLEALKDLLQAVGQEDKHLQVIETQTAALLRSCTLEGQAALSQDVQALLNKRSMLQKSIDKQLGRLGYQKTEKGCFEVASDNTEQDMDTGDTQIRMEPHPSNQVLQPTSIIKDIADSAASCPPQQHCNALEPDSVIALDTDLSTSKQERPMLDPVDPPPLQDVPDCTSFLTLQQDEATKTECKDTTHNANVTSQQWAESCPDKPAPKNMATIVLDTVSNPQTLKPDKQVESSKDVDTNTGKFPFYPDDAKSMDSKAKRTKCEGTRNLIRSSGSVKEIQSAVLAEAVQSDQAANACIEHLQTHVSTKSSTEEADVLESSQWATDGHQAATVSAKGITEADVLHNPRNDKTNECNSRSVSYQENSTSVVMQEVVIPNDRKTNEPDADQADAQNSECSKPCHSAKRMILDSNEKNCKENRTIETSTFKHMSAVSSPCHQTGDTKFPDTTDATFSLSYTAKPMDLLITDSKQEEAKSTTQIDLMNSLQRENMDGRQATATNSDSVAMNCQNSETTITVPLQREFHAEPSSKDNSDSDRNACSQVEEMFRSGVSGGGQDENRGSKDRNKESRRHIQDQPAEVSGWTRLLDIITNVQPLMDTNTVYPENQSRRGTWFLEPTLTDSENRLERTVLRVLRCRYQPAQLNTELMTRQLQEAEKCRQSVVEQVTALPQSVDGGYSQQSPSMEERRSAALLDASVTVQVKEAQLHQVTQYHQQVQVLLDTLEDLEAELDALNLGSLQSSSIQSEKLHAFLKTMKQKKGLLEELLHTCCQVSVHLGDAEGPVACLHQVKNVQEKWQILEATADRALRHADICASEASILLKDAKVLLGDLEALQITSPSLSSQTHVQCQSAVQRMTTLSDFMEMNERYLYLLELCQDLFQCPLGEKEREDIEQALQNVKSHLDCMQEKLGTHVTSSNDDSLTKITEIMKDYFTWAKQIEFKVTRRKKLALFFEEANQQVNSMKKLQVEISSRRSQCASVVKKLRGEITGLSEQESSVMFSALETLENLYIKISEMSDCVAAELNQMLHARQRLESQITENSTWLTSLLEKECSKSAAVELGSTIADLKIHHQRHKATLHEAERRLVVIQTLLDEIKDMFLGLSIAESFHLVDKLTTLQAEVEGVLRRKRTSCWELEELLHAQESSAEEFAAIQKSLRQMTSDFERQRCPVTQEALSAFEPVRHMLMEHLSLVQEAHHCQEHRRKDLLHTILTLQGRVRLLDHQAKEHEFYLTSKQYLEVCSKAIKMTVPLVSDASTEASKRLRLGQTLLVELPLLKMFCQEAADQLEAISADLYPSQLSSERQKIRSIIKSLAAWEHLISNEVKVLEHSLVEDLSNPMELTALTKLFVKSEEQLKQNNGLEPHDQCITNELRKCWTLERTVESALRMLEACKDHPPTEDYRKITDTGRKFLKECKMHMEKLLQAKEALKEYQRAVRGAMDLIQQVEFRLLIPSSSFKDCTEELRHSQQTLASLSEGFQAHMAEIQSRLPQRSCFSVIHTEKLHIQVLSQLLVSDAILETQAQLKLKTLQRCLMEQSIHTKHHDEMNQLLRNFDCKLSESFSHKPTCLEKCKDQIQEIKMLQEELESMDRRLEELRESCQVQACNVASDRTLGNLWRHWAMLQRRLDAFKSRLVHTETEWKEIMLRINKSREVLNRLDGSLTDFSKMKRSLENLQGILAQTEQLQDALDQEHLNVVSLQRCGSNLQDLGTLTELSQELQSLQSYCRRLREQISEVRRDVLSDIQEWGRLQEELKAVQQSVFSLLSVLQNQSDPSHIQEMKVELGSQHGRLQDIMNRVKKKSNEPPQEIQTLHEEITLCLQEVKEKVKQAIERASPLHKMSEQLGEVTVGLNCVQALLQKKSSTVKEAENTLKRVWDELDQWHSQITELEAEVQELAQEQPERAHMLMDELTKPLQFYQAVAKQAEQRTAFISRIPSCLQEYEDILHSSTCWLAEAQSWLDTPHTYTTAKCLHSHANSLQMVLDESEGIRSALEAIGPALEEISAVCDTSSQQQKLLQVHTSVVHMHHRSVEPLTQLQHAAAEMDAIEAEVKTTEKNVTKIRTILSTVGTEDISLEEHLQNRQVILDNLQVMKTTIAEIERCRAGLGLPAGAEDTLSAFHRAQLLQQPIHDLQQLTVEQSATIRVAIGHPVELISPSEQAMASSLTLQCPGDIMQVPAEIPHAGEEDDDDYEDEDSHSSSETLTYSVPEDPDEILMDEEHAETDATIVVQFSVSEESPQKETKSMESEPLTTDSKSGITVSCTQHTGSVTAENSSVVVDTDSVPAIADRPMETLTQTVEPALQLALASEMSEETQEILKDIKQAEILSEDPKGLTVKDSIKSENTETSAIHPDGEDKNKEATNVGTQSETQETSTDQSISKSTNTEEDTCTSVSKVQRRDAPVSEVVETMVPALVISHRDTETELQNSTTLEVQSELREQRDLIEAIARHSSSSDLEQEEQTQTQTHPRSSGVCVPGQAVEKDMTRETWTKLHHRLQPLLDSLNTVQDKTTSEGTGLAEHEVDSDIGPSLIQEMHRHSEQLQHIHQNACSMGTKAAVAELWGAVQSELYETLTGLSHSLSSITQTVHTPSERNKEACQLQLLNLQCVSAQLVSVSSEIRSIGSEITEALGPEASVVSSCLECLHSCISSSQKALSSQEELVSRQLGHTPQLQAGKQLLESPVLMLKAKEVQQSDSRSLIQDRPKLQSVQGSVWSSVRGLQCSVEEGPALRRSCQALLQALRALLELGPERVQSSQVQKPQSCSELQRLLKEHKKYFQELKRYYVMIQHLSEKLPEEALQGQEEIGQLITEILLQAQEQGAHMQYNLQEWSQYEEIRGRLCKQLEELEATMPKEGLDSEPAPELEKRLQAYQWLRGRLKENRPQLGLLQDFSRTLQTQGSYWERAGLPGPGEGLQANWRAFRRRLEHEIQRTKEMRVNYDRFQSSSAELEAWMETARVQVQKCNSIFDSNPSDSKHLLPKLMEFCRELESKSVLKAAAVRAGTQILQLSDNNAPELHKHLTQLEQDWTELSSTLPSVQHTLQQLLAGLNHGEVIAEMTSWLERMEGRLREESSREHHVLNCSELTTLLQQLKDCKAEITSRQLCVDFLNQSVEEVGFLDDLGSRKERLCLAEQLGDLNLRWILLQRKIDSQIHEIEHKKHDCKKREGRLQQLRTWVSEQQEKTSVTERPASWTQIEQALRDYKEEEEKLNLKSVELLQLRNLHLLGQHDGQHPMDQAFCSEVESTIQQCQSLRQQMCTIQANLVMLKEQWTDFDTELRDTALHTAGMSYKLELSKTHMFSLQQSKEHVEELQELQMELERSQETWTKLSSFCSELKGKIHPAAALLLSDRLDREKTRWTVMVQDVGAELQKAQSALNLWRDYSMLYGDCSVRLSRQWQKYEVLFSPLAKEENSMELLHSRLNAISVLENEMEALQNNVADLLMASKPLIAQMESHAAPLIQTETRLLSRDLVRLGQALVRRQVELQEELEEHVSFNTDLESLEQHLKSYENLIASTTASTECLKLGLMEQSGLTPDLGDLNKRSLTLTLSASHLQLLNTQWMQVFSQATAKHRGLYSQELCAQSFQKKCQAWMDLLEKVESGLSNDISGNYSSIREQLSLHQKLKMEVLTGQQLLDAVVSEALRLLERGQIVDRCGLVLRLTRLKERWQGTLCRVQQRSKSLEQLTDKWKLYSTDQKTLWKLLRDLEPLLPPAGLALCSLKQLQHSIQDYELAEEQLSIHEELYTQTIQTGRQILVRADAHTQTKLNAEMGALKEAWEQCRVLVEKRKALTKSVIQNWDNCETGLAESALKLREISIKLKQPLGDNLELQVKLLQEHGDSLELWAGGLKELATMKADVSQYVLPTDATLLQGQVEELHSQWEELCLRVSKRKQEIADRLNAWIIFNDKNKELCEWLAQMEKKVTHSNEHLSIEEMVEKLKKDCMEEINLFSENKSHLKQLGEQLLLASERAKEAEIHGALRDVNDRWQHLFDHIEARVNKLKETMVTVQQLDKNMSNLRTWLSRIEAELAKPVHYSICHGDEIQKRLAEQQELQRDIEQHTEGVASVLTLCDVLLHDEDACSSDSENDSIQLTTRSLDQRWRNICSMSLERRMRIEETWRLWCKFQEDYSRFEDWLNLTERAVAEPKSSDVLYTVAKEELKTYEAFQREVLEKLTQLEIINNQYRRLARENRTDTASRLRAMVHQGNQRWDMLQRKVAAVLRRLRHFTAQREEFESTRESLLVWLTEMDLQLTNVEHFSESDIHQKLKQLNGFKKEITLNTNKIDALIVFGESLIQRSSPLDAALIEDELEELHSYCQEVFSRVARFHQRLTSPRPLLLEEPDLCGTESTAETEGSNLAEVSQNISQPSMCFLAPPQERSGRETPVSVDSIPLEWDHTGDVGGSSSHEEDEDSSFFSSLSGVEVTESPEAFLKSTVQVLTPTLVPGQDVAVTQNWSSQSVPEKKPLTLDLPDTEHPSPAQTSTPYKQDYVQLMSQCSSNIRSVKKVSLILDEEQQQEDHGLTGLTAADKQSGVIERWELLQARAVSEEQCSSRDPRKLTSDLLNITSWLGRVAPELERLQKAETSVSVEIMEARVKELKEMQKAFARYKTLMLSLNLGGRELQCEASVEMQQLQEGLRNMNQGWTQACMGLEGWEDSLRNSLMRCQEFHEMLHSLLLWLAHAESRRYTINILDPSVPPSKLQEHRTALMCLEDELKNRQKQVGSLQEIASELLPESGEDDNSEAREKLHVIGIKLRLLLRQVRQDLQTVQERLESSEAVAVSKGQGLGSSSKELAAEAGAGSRSLGSSRVEKRDPSPQRSFFVRVLRAAFPLHLLFLLLLVLACLVPLSEQDYSCTLSNNFARSFYPMLRYTNGPPPT